MFSLSHISWGINMVFGTLWPLEPTVQIESNFTVPTLHTRTQGDLGSGIRSDLVLVIFLCSVALSGCCPYL